ncbi:hypothetical protein [Salinicola socius]|uniref:Uncharacterized protein n=1 Tax=Salinicola socius TaxID=404433 RepID=A0A1Q8SXP7_9GAMM|nr:hypothetical protein [Salinicola socius]OLO06191.1 hypothetical protein BTW07_01480 [Salinicola socius]
MSTKWMNAGLALGAMLIAGSAVAQELDGQGDKDKSSGSQVGEQQGAHETETQAEGAPKLARECLDLALQEDEGSETFRGNSIYENNAKEYDAEELEKGDTFELLVDLLGEGNAKYNLTCEIDADGNMTYKGMGESTSVKS